MASTEAHLSVVQTRIAANQELLEQLYDHRAALFARLVDEGHSQAEVARMAGVTAQTVSVALRRTRT